MTAASAIVAGSVLRYKSPGSRRPAFWLVYEAAITDTGGVRVLAAVCRKDGRPKTRPRFRYITTVALSASWVSVVSPES